jgi:hypothetical protein
MQEPARQLWIVAPRVLPQFLQPVFRCRQRLP